MRRKKLSLALALALVALFATVRVHRAAAATVVIGPWWTDDGVTLTLNRNVAAAGFTGTQPVTFAALSNLGGGTVTCDTADGFQCTQAYGWLIVTSGTGTTAAGNIITMTWATPFTSKPVCVFEDGAQGDQYAIHPLMGPRATQSTTQLTIATGSTPPTSHTYLLGYHCGN